MQELFQSPNNVSLLSFQPYQALDESSCPFWLWKVMIDGHVFPANMSPVCASDDWVERNACTACGMPGCGSDFYSVRRLGGKILWIYEELFDSEKLLSFENLPQSFVFDGAEYEKLLVGFPECHWLVGSNKEQTCVMFLAYPNLPCWISWDGIAAVFGAYCES